MKKSPGLLSQKCIIEKGEKNICKIGFLIREIFFQFFSFLYSLLAKCRKKTWKNNFASFCNNTANIDACRKKRKLLNLIYEIKPLHQI